jgi:hypothetical protein
MLLEFIRASCCCIDWLNSRTSSPLTRASSCAHRSFWSTLLKLVSSANYCASKSPASFSDSSPSKNFRRSSEMVGSCDRCSLILSSYFLTSIVVECLSVYSFQVSHHRYESAYIVSPCFLWYFYKIWFIISCSRHGVGTSSNTVNTLKMSILDSAHNLKEVKSIEISGRLLVVSFCADYESIYD